MPTDIIETATKGTTISVPIGTDTRTAASLNNAWQAIGNRLLWLEEVIERLGGASATLNASGSFIPPASLVFDLSTGALSFIGNDDFNIHLGGVGGSPGGVQFFANGLMASHLFTAGRTGRVNAKCFAAAPGANTTIDVLLYNHLAYTPSADLNVQIDISGSTGAGAVLQSGDGARFINYSTSFSISVRDPANAEIIALGVAASAAEPSWADVYYNGSAWKTGAHNQ